MKAIILAAGRGSRMGSMTDKLPKCRTILHGKELIEWQLLALKKSGISDISVVRGYLSKTFDFDLAYFDNNRWEETNMVSSLMCADEWLSHASCIVSYSDIIYSQDATKRLINASGDIVLTFDPNWKELWSRRFKDPLSDAESFIIDGGRVVEIGKRETNVNNIEGQYMGLIKFTPKGWRQINSYLNNFSHLEVDNMDMTTLLQGVINSGVEVRAIPIGDCWYEVDSESDLKVYEELPPIA